MSGRLFFDSTAVTNLSRIRSDCGLDCLRMPAYRLYCLDDAGKFTKVHDIAADSDVEAIQHAADKKLGVRCELWDRGRLVAELPATKV